MIEVKEKNRLLPIARFIAELIPKIANLHLEKPKHHPWEIYLENEPRTSRLVNRIACHEISEEISTKQIQEIVKKVLVESDSPILCLGREYQTKEILVDSKNRDNNQPTLLIAEKDMTPAEICKLFKEQSENCWALVGVVRNNGKRFLFAVGDHLAEDGGFYMKIFDQIQDLVKDQKKEEEEVQIYEDGDKNILTKLVKSSSELNYQDVLLRLLKVIAKNNKTNGTNLVFPVREMVANKKRMLPMHIHIEHEKLTEEYISAKINEAVKNKKKIDSPAIKWIRMLHEPGLIPRTIYQALSNSLLGKIANHYFKGDVLFSVMEAKQAISSTTIAPNPNSLICTIIRRPDTKKVLSVSLSGNKNYYSTKKLESIAEQLKLD